MLRLWDIRGIADDRWRSPSSYLAWIVGIYFLLRINIKYKNWNLKIRIIIKLTNLNLIYLYDLFSNLYAYMDLIVRPWQSREPETLPNSVNYFKWYNLSMVQVWWIFTSFWQKNMRKFCCHSFLLGLEPGRQYIDLWPMSCGTDYACSMFCQ